MPEGPSILIVKEAIAPIFKGKKITALEGNAPIDKKQFVHKKITAIRTWGKHLLICFPDKTIRIHFLMFGTYSIDEQIRLKRSVRLKFNFGKKSLYFYTCAVKLLEGDIEKLYDWKADVLNTSWSASGAKKKLKNFPDTMICDALLDQEIFSGVGNIIKNEVLYRIFLHPESLVKNIPARKMNELLKEASNYSYDFLKWKKELTLSKHWLAYTKKKCSRCDLPFIKKYCGKTKRRTYFCTNCQLKYK